MINLLPDERKHELRAARMNVLLLRYNVLVLITLGFLVATCAVFFFILQNAQANATSTSSVNTATAASYAEVRADAADYKNNLTIASQILNNSVNYSSFIFSVAQVLPSGAVIDNITLSSSSFTQQTTFIVRVTSFEKATELKERFQNSDLFTNVYFQSLVDNNAGSEGASSQYPILVTISAKINKVIQ